LKYAIIYLLQGVFHGMEEILGVGPSGWDHFLHAGVEGEPAEKRVRLEPEKEEDKNVNLFYGLKLEKHINQLLKLA